MPPNALAMRPAVTPYKPITPSGSPEFPMFPPSDLSMGKWPQPGGQQSTNPNVAFVEKYADDPMRALLGGAARAHEATDMGHRMATGIPSKAKSAVTMLKSDPNNPYASLMGDQAQARKTFPGAFAQPTAQPGQAPLPQPPQSPIMETFEQWGRRRYRSLGRKKVTREFYEKLHNEYQAEQKMTLDFYKSSMRQHESQLSAAILQSRAADRGAKKAPTVRDRIAATKLAGEARRERTPKKLKGKETMWQRLSEAVEAGDAETAAKLHGYLTPKDKLSMSQALARAVGEKDFEKAGDLIKWNAAMKSEETGVRPKEALGAHLKALKATQDIYFANEGNTQFDEKELAETMTFLIDAAIGQSLNVEREAKRTRRASLLQRYPTYDKAYEAYSAEEIGQDELGQIRRALREADPWYSGGFVP